MCKAIYLNALLNLNSTTAVPVGNAMFGSGRGPILLDDVKCLGNETGLGACDHKPFGVNNCDHTEDAGVFCLTGGLTIFLNRNSFSTSVVVAVHELFTFPLLSLKYFLEKYFNFKKTIPVLYNLWTTNLKLISTYW